MKLPLLLALLVGCSSLISTTTATTTTTTTVCDAVAPALQAIESGTWQASHSGVRRLGAGRFKQVFAAQLPSSILPTPTTAAFTTVAIKVPHPSSHELGQTSTTVDATGEVNVVRIKPCNPYKRQPTTPPRTAGINGIHSSSHRARH